MLRRNRFYRVLRTSLTIIAAAWRYLWLTLRSRWRLIAPSQRAWDKAHTKTGQAVYGLATTLGGAYVKLGQIVGGRGDFFPQALVAPLAGLHDRVPPRPFDELREHVESELGKPITEVFESVDEDALAAASLAQVHRGVLKSGETVAIKIQYPEARHLFPTDLGSLRRAVRVARRLNRALDLRGLVDELAQFVVLELDFSREASSTKRVRANLLGDSGVDGAVVPLVHEELSTEKLLVLEFVDGISLANDASLEEAGIDRAAVARKIAEIYGQMIFVHGFFNGDPHPGNFLARVDGSVALLDFGLAKELPDGFAIGIAKMIVGVMAGNGEQAIAAAESVGFVFRSRDPDPFLGTVRMLLGDYSNTDRLAKMMKATGVKEVPPAFALIVRAFVLLNGLSHRLVPDERVIMNTLAARLLAQLATPQAGEKAANA